LGYSSPSLFVPPGNHLCIMSSRIGFILVCTYIFLPFVQLDEACRRGTHPKDRSKSKEANIGGPMILLSIWSWEHLPVGRPTLIGLGYDQWDDHNDPDHRPTWAYCWDKVEGFIGSSKTAILALLQRARHHGPGACKIIRLSALLPFCFSQIDPTIWFFGFCTGDLGAIWNGG
jgi:hypothetical protein